MTEEFTEVCEKCGSENLDRSAKHIYSEVEIETMDDEIETVTLAGLEYTLICLNCQHKQVIQL